MPRISVYPADDISNGWGAFLQPRTSRPPLEADVSAHWLVVGAGFAGLAAARRLATNRPNDAIVLLEAQNVGDGTSGRNSGFAVDLPVTLSTSLEELEASKKRVRLSRAAIEYLEACITQNNIDCQWRRRGKYHAAATPRGMRLLLRPFMQELDALGEPYRFVDQKRMYEETGTPYYFAGVHTSGDALMNPVALTRGLADTLPSNVALYENSPVTQADYGEHVLLQTRGGSIRAPKMILAANGFAPEFGFYQRNLMTIALHASLTRSLSPREHDALGGVMDWGLTSAASAAGVTVRYTLDRRILIRQTFDFCPNFHCSAQRRSQIGERHQETFARRFPMLPDVKIDHTWTGFVCVSRNRAFGFGKVHPRVFSAVCQNSLGVTMGTISGVLAADLASEQPNPLTADLQSFGTPRTLPPRPLLDIGVAARFAWDVWWTGSDF